MSHPKSGSGTIIDLAQKLFNEHGHMTMSEAKKVLKTSKWKTVLRNTGIAVGALLAAFAIVTAGDVLKHRDALKYAYEEKHIPDPNIETEEIPQPYHGD